MIRKYTYKGRHRKPSEPNTSRAAVIAGAVLAASIALPGFAQAAPSDVWDRLAQCESGGNWSINTGNSYYGGLQHSLRTWRAFGGEGMPHQASRSEQIAVATRVQATQGWGAWPACSRRLGLRGDPPRQARQEVARETVREAPREAPAPRRERPRTERASSNHYTVRPGDTLGRIAARNGTTWQALFAKNRDVVENPNRIFVGEQLHI